MMSINDAEPAVTDAMVEAARQSLYGDLMIANPEAVQRALRAALAEARKQMTDTERQKLCTELRRSLPFGYKGGPILGNIAADEIERLAKKVKELEQALEREIYD